MSNRRTNKKWEEFRYAYMDFPWFDDYRVKTAKAMRTLCERMPKRDKDRIPPEVLVYAPSQHIWGEKHTIVQLPNMPKERHIQFIYLSPELEKRSQSFVNATVAHEFAHVILEHKDVSADRFTCEKEADALIQKWGYQATNSCDWMQREKKHAK